MFTISGVDSLESRLRSAQEELGVPPSDWVPVTYKAQSDTLLAPPTTISIIISHIVLLVYSALVLAAISMLLILRILIHFIFPTGSGAASKSGSSATINPFVSHTILLTSLPPHLPPSLSVIHESCQDYSHQ